jgi:putative flippase GtrA
LSTESQVTKTAPSALQSFTRSQVSSFAATCADFGLLFTLTEIFHVWYVLAVALGAVSGAVTNFLLNRHWSFAVSSVAWHRQAVRYTLSSIGSLLLNTAGTWLVTEYLHVHYSISVIAVSLVVGFGYNYPLHRFWVFRGQSR